MDANVKQKMIELTLSQLSAGELEKMLHITDMAIREREKYQANGSFLELLKSDQLSTAFKTIGVMVNRTWRAFSMASNPVERADLLRELAVIRDKCAIRAGKQPSIKYADKPATDASSRTVGVINEVQNGNVSSGRIASHMDVTRLITDVKPRKIGAILVPMITREINDLEVLFVIWSMYSFIGSGLSQESISKPVLIVTLDCGRDATILERIKDAYNANSLGNVFNSLRVEFCAIPERDNCYIRHGQAMPEEIPLLGLKSGPNTQFFQSITDYCSSYDIVLLNEVDCYPVAVDWINKLNRLVMWSEDFWILGSPYRGNGKLGPQIISHVNGNALYGVGSTGFENFIVAWKAELINLIKEDPNIAYDVFFEYKYSGLYDPAKWGGQSSALFKEYQQKLCKIRYTSIIHNVAGEPEISGQYKINLEEYTKNNPEAVLMHGRFLKADVLRYATSELNKLDMLTSASKQAALKWL